MSEVQTEILDVLGEKKQGKKEDRQTFLKRIRDAADAFWFPTDANGDPVDANAEADKAWGDLTEATQQWINAAIKLEDGADISDFPDIEAEDENETETDETKETEDMTLRDDSDEETTTKTAKKSAKGKAKAKVAPKVAPKVAKKVEKAPAKGKEKAVAAKGKADKAPAKGASGRPAKRGNGVSGYTMIREIMRRDTNTKLADLIAALEKKGYSLSPNATAVIRTNFLATIRELHEAGCIKSISMPD